MQRTTHNPNSDTTTVQTVLDRVSVTTSRGRQHFWLDIGVWPNNTAATLTVEQSRQLRKALKRAERIAQEDRA